MEAHLGEGCSLSSCHLAQGLGLPLAVALCQLTPRLGAQLATALLLLFPLSHLPPVIPHKTSSPQPFPSLPPPLAPESMLLIIPPVSVACILQHRLSFCYFLSHIS